MRNITVREGQTLVDIAVQYLGDDERTYEIATLNNLQLTDDLTAGQLLAVPDAAIDKQWIADDFTELGLFPASADNGLEGEDSGIDFWAIEDDFIVQ